ncbi:MAG: MlaE family ABC transporter permease [Acidobacteriota bacterium]
MTFLLRTVGRVTLETLAEMGALWRLGQEAFCKFIMEPFRGRRMRLGAVVAQSVEAGYNSMFLVSLLVFLLGMIMALQSAYQLKKLGGEELVANLVAVAVVRELAPLLTAIIVAGRFGSAIAAGLATMKVSQEIDALKVMGIEPVSYLVVPRLLALMLALPCLTIFSDLVGILGGLVVGIGPLGLGLSSYVEQSIDALLMEDIVTGLVKALVFAGIIGLVGCHQGLKTEGGAEAVGHSTTAAVVLSIVLVIAADLFVTAIFYTRG